MSDNDDIKTYETEDGETPIVEFAKGTAKSYEVGPDGETPIVEFEPLVPGPGQAKCGIYGSLWPIDEIKQCSQCGMDVGPDAIDFSGKCMRCQNDGG